MKKGFTLIELLVVIAILAVLMSVIVVTLNPAEMLKKTRDTKRIADLDTLRTAISLYIADVGGFTGTGTNVTSTTCYLSTGSTFSGTGVTGCTTFSTTTASQSVNGTGWIPMNFSNISSGAPISSLPIDPKPTLSGDTSPTGWHIYVFKANTTSATFKLMTNMESTYYSNGGGGDVESTDGGTSTTMYEVGSDVTGL